MWRRDVTGVGHHLHCPQEHDLPHGEAFPVKFHRATSRAPAHHRTVDAGRPSRRKPVPAGGAGMQPAVDADAVQEGLIVRGHQQRARPGTQQGFQCPR